VTILPTPANVGRGRLDEWLSERLGGERSLLGLPSVCTSHEMVLEAVVRRARREGTPVLVEATCNQVNHHGGYSGLTPAAFRDMVLELAASQALSRRQVLLGGDHLGPNPWRSLPSAAAMAEAATMVASYATAGFDKLHIDTSMRCADDGIELPDDVVAARAAQLVAVAEQAAAGSPNPPVYVIGTEVPSPGGSAERLHEVHVTSPDALLASVEAHRKAFARAGLEAAFGRVVALVAHPGVEFDNANVLVYDRSRAEPLLAALDELPTLAFEAHSTDYQPPEKLAMLVKDGFRVLKVGPALTFALREALYALDSIASELGGQQPRRCLKEVMETVMVQDPQHWQAYYRGGPPKQRLLRHFSYSDRIRYYWQSPAARQAVEGLLEECTRSDIPLPLVSQFLPSVHKRLVAGELAGSPAAWALQAIDDVLEGYWRACFGAGAKTTP
jgi:D-tagatose-bisphosphate aldolase class II non-catalytic subunit